MRTYGVSGSFSKTIDVDVIKRYNEEITKTPNAITAYYRALSDGNGNIIQCNKATRDLIASQNGAMVSTEALKEAQDAASKSGSKFAGVMKTLKGALINFGIMLAIEGIIALAKFTQKTFFPTTKQLRKQLEETAQAVRDNNAEIDSLNNELSTTANRIKELQSQGQLSLTDEAELLQLQKENAELERKIRLRKDANVEAQKKAIKDFNNAVDKPGILGDNHESFVLTTTTGYDPSDNTPIKERDYVGVLQYFDELQSAYVDTDTDLTTVKVCRTGKNIVNIPNINRYKNGTDATGISIPCYITKPITISGVNDHAVIRDSAGNAKNVWRIKCTYKNGNTSTIIDSEFPYKTLQNISDENPIISITYRDIYIASGQYKNIQVEVGKTATEYESYTGTDFTPNADGTVEGVIRLYPNTTLMVSTDNVIIDCEYNRDINKALAELEQAIISLGGNL